MVLEGAPDAACREALERWGVPGAVVGVLADGKADVRAYGVADLATGEPVGPDTTFRVASITKPFTATLALLLAGEGVVALDRPVPLPLPAERLTPSLLLAHLGGFEGEAGDLARFGDGDDALARAVAELPRQRVVVPPGTYWSYCNAGYWAVGLLCARAAGTTYEEALRTRVLAPLGVTATGFGEPQARGHVQPDLGAPAHEPVPPGAYPRARRPSGGLVSTVPDLLRFAAFHLGDERLAALRVPLAGTPGGEYGLGWFCERVDGVEVWSHPGSYGGFETLLALVPEREAAAVVRTNGTGGDAFVRDAGAALLEAASGARRTAAPTVPLVPAELELLAGRYAQPELEAAVSAGRPGLVVDAVAIERTGGGRVALPRLEARPVGPRTFAVVGGRWAETRFDFLPVEGPARFARLGSVLAERC